MRRGRAFAFGFGFIVVAYVICGSLGLTRGWLLLVLDRLLLQFCGLGCCISVLVVWAGLGFGVARFSLLLLRLVGFRCLVGLWGV